VRVAGRDGAQARVGDTIGGVPVVGDGEAAAAAPAHHPPSAWQR
jgi:hypothetical protein